LFSSQIIEKFIEEQDIYPRKSSTLTDDSAISIVTIHQQETINRKRSFDHDDETTVSTKKSSIE